MVERAVSDIDQIAKFVRLDGWQNTRGGKREMKKALTVYWRGWFAFHPDRTIFRGR